LKLVYTVYIPVGNTVWRARALCFTSTPNSIEQLYKELCQPGVTRLLHFVRANVVVSSCRTCAEIKPRIYHSGKATLVRVMKPMERSKDLCRWDVGTGHTYWLIVINKYSNAFASRSPARI